MLQPSTVHIPAGLPIDESTRPELLNVGQANLRVENLRQDQFGGLTTRLGVDPLTLARIDGTYRTAGRRLVVSGEQLCTIDGTHIDVYSETAVRSVRRNRVPECTVRVREAPSLGSRGLVSDCLCVNGYVVVSQFVRLSFPGFLYHGVSILDEAGAVVRGPDSLDVGAVLSDVRLAKYGNKVFAFTCEPAANEIRTQWIDLSSPTTIAAGWTSLATITDFNTGFDCANLVADDRVAIAYGSTANAGNRVLVKTLTSAGVVETATITPGAALGSDDALGVTLCEDADTLWVGYFNNLVPTVVGLDPTDLATTLASTYVLPSLGTETPVAIFICARSGDGNCSVYVQSIDTAANALSWPLRMKPIKTVAGAATPDGALVLVGGAYMASRPALISGRIYADCYSRPGLPDGGMCDVTLDTTVAYLRPVAIQFMRGLHVTGVRCRTSASSDPTRYFYAAASLETGTQALRLVEYDFADPNRWSSARVNGQTCLGGGVTMQFDGTRAFELGFLAAPAFPMVDTSVAGALTLVNGRTYVCTYEYVDANGNRHISGVSLPSSPTGPVTSKTVKVRTTPLSITSRGDEDDLAQGSVFIGVWATLDANNNQPPYYRVGEAASEPNSALAEFIDQYGDNVIATQELLYGTGSLPGTDGSSQDHRAPVGWTHIISYAGMLVGAQGRNVGWTAQNIDGEGLWTSPIFTNTLDEECTGFAQLDGTLYAFTRDRIFATAGDPPSDNATSGGLSPWRKLSHAGGCINANSIVETPQGIWFQSTRGIERLSRGGTVDWVGQPVQNTQAAYPYISAAVYDEEQSLVRFSCARAEVAGEASILGITLVYDTTINGWQSVDFYPQSVPTQDAAMAFLDGHWRYVRLVASGLVQYEKRKTDASGYLDFGVWIPTMYEMPDLKTGLNQQQRVFHGTMLFDRQSAAGILAEFAYNYGSYDAANNKTWTVAETAGQRQVEFRPKPLGWATRMRISSIEPAPSDLGNSGKGITFIGISADVAPKPGTTRATPRLAVGTRR